MTLAPMPSMAYPTASETWLKETFIGKDLRDIDGPAAVLDLAPIKKNCSIMLHTAEDMQLDFRAHVKTHKTVQLTRLQVGDDRASDARIVVSTIQEAEQQSVLLEEYQKRGRKVNLLYGVPPSKTAFSRLKAVRQRLGNAHVAFIVDHPQQLQNLVDPTETSHDPVQVFVKVDVGYHRAGLMPESNALESLLQSIKASSDSSKTPNVNLLGLYSHDSLVYGASSFEDCMEYLLNELTQVNLAATRAKDLGLINDGTTLSVGSSPSVLSCQGLALPSPTCDKARALLSTLKQDYNVELHAGVYPVLDMQQLGAKSRPPESSVSPSMTESDIGIFILSEVLSVYTERPQAEALVGSGTLALGREPCKSYSGWGVVAPRPWQDRTSQRIWTEQEQTGWVVGRISQEHGILEWRGAAGERQQLEVGEKLLIWPNHACIASAGFGWYVVVDSSRGSKEASQIEDVWVRCRGW